MNIMEKIRHYHPGGLGQPLVSILGLLAVGAFFLFAFIPFTSGMGQEQPIPFSHRFHVSTKQLSCVFCHYGVFNSDHAGLPPVDTCMLCHQRIIITHPQIQKLHEYYNSKQPIPWVRVYQLREFVFFNHERHIRAGFDCGRCHGDVAHMDRIVKATELNKMGFCVQCHRDENFSRDCVTCHR